MDMSYISLHGSVGGVRTVGIVVPLATEADFRQIGDYSSPVNERRVSESDGYAYPNADTCPDCSGGMIRQGKCCVCPSCGFESCTT